MRSRAVCARDLCVVRALMALTVGMPAMGSGTWGIRPWQQATRSPVFWHARQGVGLSPFRYVSWMCSMRPW